MPLFINDEYAEEKDTFGIKVYFWDESGSAVTPNAGLTWTLTDGSGTTINNRENVALTSATAVWVTLSGNDLAFASDESTSVKRHLLIKGTYDSSVLGSGVSLNKEIRFVLKDSNSIVNG